MKIETVKIQTYNDEFIGYKVNENSFFPKDNCELIKLWIAEGNEPEVEFTEEEIIEKNKVNAVSRLQAKLYLLDSGYYEQVMALVEQDARLQIYWNDAVIFNKDDVILRGVQAAIGLTDTQLDTMFLEASKL